MDHLSIINTLGRMAGFGIFADGGARDNRCVSAILLEGAPHPFLFHGAGDSNVI